MTIIYDGALMEIVDGQIHTWRGVNPDSLVPPHLEGDFDERRLLPLMDAAGVDRAILVTTVWTDSGNEVQLDMARRHPDRFRVMGYLDIDAPASRGALETWLAQPGMLGVRASFSRRRHAVWLTDGTADWFFGEAAKAGVPVMAYAPLRVADLGAFARKHPDLRLIADHMAVRLTVTGPELEPYIDELVKLAPLENVAVKVSSLPHFSAEPYPHEDVHPHLLRVIEHFGADRCFWGTDLTWGAEGRPLERLYREAVSMMDVALAPLSDSERESIMGAGILKWLGWPCLR
jgi:predicted TIM-barrel fold metal-dependent hydrolase